MIRRYFLLSGTILIYSLILPAQNNGNNMGVIKIGGNEVTIVEENIYTYKAQETCDKGFNYKGDTIAYFIGIKIPKQPSDTANTFEALYIGCSYGWNRIFNLYDNESKIKILEELFQYEKDISLSGKKVTRYGFVESKLEKPQTISYTLQTEALFLITLLTMGESAMMYCPYPVIVNNANGKEINNNQKEIKKVFSIYKKWFKENRKNGFVNFTPPLKDTKYKWFNGFQKINRIEKLYSSGLTIGVNQN